MSKIVQLCSHDGRLLALTEDGAIFEAAWVVEGGEITDELAHWSRLPDVDMLDEEE